MSKLSLRALNRSLLARHMLLERESVGVVAAVERLAGMQAQVPRPPYIGLWSRLAGFDRDALTKAVVKRDLVRATLMRGTLHLVSKKDYLAFRAALQPVFTRAADAIIKDAIAEREPILRDARKFFGKNACTFDELRKHLVERHPNVGDRVMGYLARMHLPLVQVPSEDAAWGYPAAADFALADAYLGKAVPNEGKPDALALSYFAAFGPATAADFQNWSGMQGGKDIVAAIRAKLESVRDERNRELFDIPGAPRPDEDTPAPVRFLADYDNLILGHADRTRIIADDYRPRVSTKNLRILPTFLVDGFVAGTWEPSLKKKVATLTITPFTKLTTRVKGELEAEGDRLLRFIESEATKFEVQIG